MHILTENISKMLADMAYIIITSKCEVAHMSFRLAYLDFALNVKM